LAEDAFPNEDINNPIISRQLIEIFVDGLGSAGLARKVIRENPAAFPEAVITATTEQNICKKFDLRGRREVPMEVASVGGLKDKNIRCYSCGKLGHMQRECRQNKSRTSKNEIVCWQCHTPGHKRGECRARNGQGN
jgi:hypothetical protein